MPQPAVGIDVTTYHYDNARDGLNANETILTPSNVNSSGFGKVGFDTTDGKVDAAPLYLSGMTVNGQTHNVLYVASEHDSVYAFDADTGTQLWKISVLGANETTSGDHWLRPDHVPRSVSHLRQSSTGITGLRELSSSLL